MEQMFKSFSNYVQLFTSRLLPPLWGKLEHISDVNLYLKMWIAFFSSKGSNGVVSMVALIFIVHCPSENRFSKTQRPSENRVIRQKMGFE